MGNPAGSAAQNQQNNLQQAQGINQQSLQQMLGFLNSYFGSSGGQTQGISQLVQQMLGGYLGPTQGANSQMPPGMSGTPVPSGTTGAQPPSMRLPTGMGGQPQTGFKPMG